MWKYPFIALEGIWMKTLVVFKLICLFYTCFSVFEPRSVQPGFLVSYSTYLVSTALFSFHLPVKVCRQKSVIKIVSDHPWIEKEAAAGGDINI